MIRTQIQLDEAQYERLKALAAKRSQSLALLVRQSVDKLLEESESVEAWDRLMDATGQCHDPETRNDVSTRHDEHLVEAYRK